LEPIGITAVGSCLLGGILDEVEAKADDVLCPYPFEIKIAGGYECIMMKH
jgi:hypothetical protein